ncbi:PREDICTED: rust resistance kinase Lr10-like [Ipomoea nil]|uniref:rust resistance kinase Lr10-like n=1 Tax=Ipomoea nil TaxID=35883 RepID=UPI000901A46D|nr:PREDICTED: rust resistance kinase Lr10-like [Ipomoea nil]
MMRLVIILAILCATNCRAHQEKRSCSASCGNIQDIRYPFRLTAGDPNSSCGLSTYELTCQNNRTILNLNSKKYFVLSITYTNFSIRILDPGLQNKTHTSSPFPLHNLNPQHLPRRYHLFQRRFNSPAAFLSCRNPANSSLYVKSQSEDSSFSYVLVGKHVDVGKIEDSCSITGAAWFSTSQLSPYPGKMSLGKIHDALAYGFELSWLPLKCSAVCGKKHCRIEDDNTIACVYASRLASNSNSMPLLHKCEIFGPFLVVSLVILATIGIYFLNKKKKEQMKIERFLDDYKALKPARYLYADIKKITNKFSEKLGEGAYGTVYKGKLSDDVFVAVKVLNNSKGDGEEFINEVSTIGSTHHVNVVRLVGYCADGFHRALVYEYLVNDSLEKFIFSPNEKNFLGWEKLQQIALGIAKGIEYLHQGCDQRILHFDIKPNNILLDENLNPKISDFGQAKLCSKEKSIVSMTNARGTMGYIAPEVFSRNFGNVSYKSDVYSFGMLLLEMVGGRNKSDDVGSSEIPEWIYNMMNKGEEEIENEGDDCKIARKLTIVGLWCIQWYPVDRPSIKVVIQMIEAEEPPSMPPNPFGSTHPSCARASKPGKMFTSGLEIITESEG